MPMMDVVNLAVWYQLKPYLPPGTCLMSVHRSPQAQLDFIVAKARRHGYNFVRPPSLHDPSSWQAALTLIREKGYKVAAPGRSPHQQGIAYDLTGPDLRKIEASVRRAVGDKRITLAHSRTAILVETKNQCVHVEVVGAVLHNEPFDFFHTV